jgi:UTP--glucose-1-phosphate uridylyltransferase
LNQIQRVFAYDFEEKRYDVGEKLGFVKTTIEFALQREDLRDEMMAFLREVVSSS